MNALLHKVRYDKSTNVMTPEEEKYYLYMLQGDPIVGDYIRGQMRTNPHIRRDIFHQPVCARCEKFAFHHGEGVMCPSCGHWSTNKTHKILEHLGGGHYK